VFLEVGPGYLGLCIDQEPIRIILKENKPNAQT
jgi:hypothetical protein